MNLPDQFLNWRMINDRKVPCTRDGSPCDPHDPKNHITRAEAEAAPYGVAFALREDDPWFFLDLDKCFDTATQQWTTEAQAIWTSFTGAWGEVSQSGAGLHIMGKCDVAALATRRNKWDGWLECYTKDRFIAFGPHGWQPIGGTERDIDWTDHLLRLVPEREFLGDLPDGRDLSYTGPEDDDELITMMLRSTSTASAFGEGVTIKDLWDGNVTALAKKYPAYDDRSEFDHSSADAALMSHLAFWTGKDMPRMDRLFRRSALMRDKYEKRADYRRDTIQNAARLCKRVYDRAPSVPSEPPAQQTTHQGVEMYLTVPEMIEHFKGCVYIVDDHKVLTPDGKMLKPEQFRAVYGGHVFQMEPVGSKTTTNAFEALTECRAHRFRKAQTTAFHPELPFQEWIGEAINIYRPADVDSRQGDVTPFFDFLRRLLPNETDRSILMSWCIDVVQNPGRKMLWAPVIQGTEGNGKSLVFEVLSRAIGEEYVHMPRTKELGSAFNGWQVNKLFINVAEFHMNGRREILDDLKPNITDMRLPIRQMHKTEANIHVPTNWGFTTNHKDAVLKSRTDRRYAPFFTAQQSRSDVERDFPGDYFPKLWDWLRDEGFAFMTHYLRNASSDPRFSPMNGCTRAPETSSTVEAMAASTGGIEAEVLEAIESDTIGFRGGWVSAWALDNLLRERGLRLSRPRISEMMSSLGYKEWGRAPRPILSEDGKRPKLWTSGDLDAAFESYLGSQRTGYE